MPLNCRGIITNYYKCNDLGYHTLSKASAFSVAEHDVFD